MIRVTAAALPVAVCALAWLVSAPYWETSSELALLLALGVVALAEDATDLLTAALIGLVAGFMLSDVPLVDRIVVGTVGLVSIVALLLRPLGVEEQGE